MRRIAFGGLLFSLVASKLARKVALVALMAFFAVASGLCAWAPDYETLIVARVLAASAQGAFFGIGAVMAASLAREGRQASAGAMMFTGLTLANVLGVPLGTAFGHWLGWRAPFVAISVLSALGMIGLALALPTSHGEEKADIRSEVVALPIVASGSRSPAPCFSRWRFSRSSPTSLQSFRT